ncbi:unnamed protein product [Thelazia callipaeda]|uniref:SH2 domain-containing protein n=1 Tax=Thelazia callipaeda TaxID=103827 RepID=A0A158RAL2_THECL|nr:unnamed protein product [Thelazia callipaeda]
MRKEQSSVSPSDEELLKELRTVSWIGTAAGVPDEEETGGKGQLYKSYNFRRCMYAICNQLGICNENLFVSERVCEKLGQTKIENKHVELNVALHAFIILDEDGLRILERHPIHVISYASSGAEENIKGIFCFVSHLQEFGRRCLVFMEPDKNVDFIMETILHIFRLNNKEHETEARVISKPFDSACNQVYPDHLYMNICNLPAAMGLDRQPWYHGEMERATAESMLHLEGDFLVRASPNTVNNFVLSGIANSVAKHFLLLDENDQKVRKQRQVFETIVELIEYHRGENVPIISEGSELHLIRPIMRRGNLFALLNYSMLLGRCLILALFMLLTVHPSYSLHILDTNVLCDQLIILSNLQSNFVFSVRFEEPFQGIIYSEKSFPNCIYVNASILTKSYYSIKIPLDACETSYNSDGNLENIVVVQESPHYLTENDRKYLLTCVPASTTPRYIINKIFSILSETVSFGGITVNSDVFTTIHATGISDSRVQYKVELKKVDSDGSLRSLDGPVLVGDEIVYVIRVNSEAVDTRIGHCWARDGQSTLQLSDEDGCSVQDRSEVWNQFERQKQGDELIFKNQIKAWAFPTSNEVNIFCNLHTCRVACFHVSCSERRFRRNVTAVEYEENGMIKMIKAGLFVHSGGKKWNRRKFALFLYSSNLIFC